MKFDTYKKSFAYKGKAIYRILFDLHCDNIKTKKPQFAINNLEKIFNATFKISSKIGFHEMSLRDLCRETGLSMGGIYSSIESKDMIAIMVKDVVKMISLEIIENAIQQDDKQQAIDDIIRHLIYATEIQPHWFYFLFFETRSLPLPHQADSKQIEIQITTALVDLLKMVGGDSAEATSNHHFVATMALAMIQERYLKHWKYKKTSSTVDEYAEAVLHLVHASLHKEKPVTPNHTSGINSESSPV